MVLLGNTTTESAEYTFSLNALRHNTKIKHPAVKLSNILRVLPNAAVKIASFPCNLLSFVLYYYQ